MSMHGILCENHNCQLLSSNVLWHDYVDFLLIPNDYFPIILVFMSFINFIMANNNDLSF